MSWSGDFFIRDLDRTSDCLTRLRSFQALLPGTQQQLRCYYSPNSGWFALHLLRLPVKTIKVTGVGVEPTISRIWALRDAASPPRYDLVGGQAPLTTFPVCRVRKGATLSRTPDQCRIYSPPSLRNVQPPPHLVAASYGLGSRRNWKNSKILSSGKPRTTVLFALRVGLEPTP